MEALLGMYVPGTSEVCHGDVICFLKEECFKDVMITDLELVGCAMNGIKFLFVWSIIFIFFISQ